MSIEDYLKELIKFREFTVKSFSEYIGIPYSTLRDILSRDIRKTSIENYLKICSGLNIDPEKLISEFDKPSYLNNYLLSLESDLDYKGLLNADLQDKMQKTKNMIDFIESMGYSFQLGFNDLYNDDMVSLVNDQNEEVLYVSHDIFIDAWESMMENIHSENRKVEQKQFNKLINTLSDNFSDSTNPEYTIFEYTEKVSAGSGYLYGDNEVSTCYTNRTSFKSYDFATKIKGDSMEPEYHDGDIILVKSGYDNINGNIYVVDYAGESYVKKLYNDGDRFRLVSVNDRYPVKYIPVPVSDGTYFNIVGKVVDSFTPITE